MQDVLTFSDPALNGASGNLYVGFQLDATTTGSRSYNSSDGVGSFGCLYAYAGGALSGKPDYYSYYMEPGNLATQYYGLATPFTWTLNCPGDGLRM